MVFNKKKNKKDNNKIMINNKVISVIKLYLHKIKNNKNII